MNIIMLLLETGMTILALELVKVIGLFLVLILKIAFGAN
jgi:hypothetical protein